MLRSTMLAAFAAISVCAMAQDTWKDDSRDAIDANGKTHFDIKREVCRQEQFLSGGDAYAFETGLDRMQGNVEDALISGLFAAHRQAVLIRDQTIASMIPSDETIDAVVLPDDKTILTEETEGSMRPMRMVMQPERHHDIDYNTAFDILTADLNPTQVTQLAQWWNGDRNGFDPGVDSDTNTRMKDIVCRLLRTFAKKADEPIYLSLYVHHTYPIVPIN